MRQSINSRYSNSVQPAKELAFYDSYPDDAIILSEADKSYNCESFALHKSTLEWRWSNHTFSTLENLGYHPIKAMKAKAGDLLVIQSPRKIEHFGRVVKTSRKIEKTRVICKFGASHLAICNLENAVGGGYGDIATFLRKRKEEKCTN